MRLTVDGYVYEWQRRGGVSRIFSETLPRICDLEPELRIKLITQNRLVQDLPVHPRIHHCPVPEAEKFLRPRRIWRKAIPYVQTWLRKRCIGAGKDAIWHSTFFTEPDHWEGLRVATVYDVLNERFPHLFDKPHDDHQRAQMRRSISRADRVITISEASKLDVEKYYGVAGEKISVISPACSSSFRLRPGEGKETRRPFLLYVGDRNHYKNFQALLEGYGSWRNRVDYDLIVVGGGDWSQAEKESLARLELGDSVRRLAGLDDEQLALLYNKASVFIYPSLYEGFGIPLLEALACGCRVVASRIPSTIEVAGDCPTYFEPQEPDSLVAALDKAIAEARESPRQTKGFEQARKYSWNEAARQTLDVYRKLDAEVRSN